VQPVDEGRPLRQFRPARWPEGLPSASFRRVSSAPRPVSIRGGPRPPRYIARNRCT
jgi:hypothetical protein